MIDVDNGLGVSADGVESTLADEEEAVEYTQEEIDAGVDAAMEKIMLMK